MIRWPFGYNHNSSVFVSIVKYCSNSTLLLGEETRTTQRLIAYIISECAGTNRMLQTADRPLNMVALVHFLIL